MPQKSIPAFLNAAAGGAKDAQEILEKSGAFEVRAVEPDRLESEIRAAVAGGATRILVAGGDGTIGTAASVLVGTDVELALFPGGTLNHFAKANGIPTDLDEALEVATSGTPVKVDVAYVGETLFLNTSSVGAYIKFVRVRERFEKQFGYRIASILAFIRIMARLRTVSIQLEIDGTSQTYQSPMVFIGVGQRELKLPNLGGRVENGRRGLQLLVVSGANRARLLVLAFSAVAKGTKRASRTPHMDAFMAEKCTIGVDHSMIGVSVDGELAAMETPLEYRIARDALTIVVPTDANADRGASQ